MGRLTKKLTDPTKLNRGNESKPMKCPNCKLDNEPGRIRCSTCSAKLPQQPEAGSEKDSLCSAWLESRAQHFEREAVHVTAHHANQAFKGHDIAAIFLNFSNELRAEKVRLSNEKLSRCDEKEN